MRGAGGLEAESESSKTLVVEMVTQQSKTLKLELCVHPQCSHRVILQRDPRTVLQQGRAGQHGWFIP